MAWQWGNPDIVNTPKPTVSVQHWGIRGGYRVWICLAEDTKAFLLSEVCSESLWVAETDA